MARLSRLLSAVSLGIAASAAVAAVVAATEYAPLRKAPNHRVESASQGRVIVKFRNRATVQSVSTESTGSAATSATVATGPQKAGALGTRLGIALIDGRILGTHTQVLKAGGMTSSALASSIATDSEVEWVEVDHRRYVQAAVVNDPLYPDNLSTTVAPTGPASGQWYLRAPGVDASGHNVISSINIEPAWAITHGSSAVIIGDVDTGITQHPDLDSKMLSGYDFISDTDVANDGGGRDTDPTDPGDFVTAAENSQGNANTNPFFGCNDDGVGGQKVENSTWHGTQTASILGAATNNNRGMAGTGYDTPVFAARALGKCGGFDSDIIAAAQWSGGIAVSGVPANPHPARVVNMSLGGSGACTQAYADALTALRDKGVVVVVAAGNDEGLPVGTPANCKPATSSADQVTPVVIAVAALRHAGTKVGFSDIGPEVTIAAPGGNCVNTDAGTPCLYPIITALNSGTTTPVANGGIYSDGLNNISLGTSFSTPMVAGTVALMLSANPSLTNLEVSRIIQHTANAFPTVSDSSPQPPVCTVPTSTSAEQDECICTTATCGAGMLNAGAAVTTAQLLLTATAPTASLSTTSSTVVVGSTVTLSATGSGVGSTGAALTYVWSIPDGDHAITLGGTSGSSIVVTGAAAGTGQVKLLVIDANGMTATRSTSITVTAPPSSGGGGGGAANPAWLVGLAIAGLLLGSRSRRTRA